MKKYIFLSLLCASLIIAGCAGVNVTKTSKGYLAPTNPNDVEILMTKPTRSYTELATVNTSGWGANEMAKMHNSLRSKSAPLGADAVILVSSGMAMGPWGNMQYWATGVAIHYNDKQ